MGGRLSTSRRQASAEEVQVESIMSLPAVVNQREHLERLFQGTSRAFRRFHLRSVRQLRRCLHNAIEAQDLDYLRFLVEDCDGPLEETNDQGMTALYNAVFSEWTDGALLLLKHGADAVNADRALSDSSCFFLPLIRLVVKLGSLKLLKKFIKGRAAINASDFDENNCLECYRIHTSPSIRKYLYQKVVEKNLQKGHGGDHLIVLFDAVYSDFNAEVSISKMKSFIRWKHALEEGETMLVLGAWLALRRYHHQALECWRKALRGKSHSQTKELVRASESIFADILNVEMDHLLHSPEAGDFEVHAQTLFLLEKYTPTDIELTLATLEVARDLQALSEKTAAIAMMRRLTGLRVLPKVSAVLLVHEVRAILFPSRFAVHPSLSVLLDSMAVLAKCLSVLIEGTSFSPDKSMATRHDASTGRICCDVCIALSNLRDTFFLAIIFFEQDTPATSEQLEEFHHHIKAFVSSFPWICGQNPFHSLIDRCPCYLDRSFLIKTMVVCSAEVKGTNRHVNSPPHLASDKYGDTPLHIFARCLSREELGEDGVLQCCLDHGAHLCTRNNDGESIRDILLELDLLKAEQTVLSLQCLAATAFMNDARLRRYVHTCQPEKVRHFLLNH